MAALTNAPEASAIAPAPPIKAHFPPGIKPTISLAINAAAIEGNVIPSLSRNVDKVSATTDKIFLPRSIDSIRSKCSILANSPKAPTSITAALIIIEKAEAIANAPFVRPDAPPSKDPISQLAAKKPAISNKLIPSLSLNIANVSITIASISFPRFIDPIRSNCSILANSPSPPTKIVAAKIMIPKAPVIAAAPFNKDFVRLLFPDPPRKAEAATKAITETTIPPKIQSALSNFLDSVLSTIPIRRERTPTIEARPSTSSLKPLVFVLLFLENAATRIAIIPRAATIPPSIFTAVHNVSSFVFKTTDIIFSKANTSTYIPEHKPAKPFTPDELFLENADTRIAIIPRTAIIPPSIFTAVHNVSSFVLETIDIVFSKASTRINTPAQKPAKPFTPDELFLENAATRIAIIPRAATIPPSIFTAVHNVSSFVLATIDIVFSKASTRINTPAQKPISPLIPEESCLETAATRIAIIPRAATIPPIIFTAVHKVLSFTFSVILLIAEIANAISKTAPPSISNCFPQSPAPSPPIFCTAITAPTIKATIKPNPAKT